VVYSNLTAKTVEYDGKVTFLPDRELLPVIVKDINKAEKEIVLAIYMFKTNDKKHNDSTLIQIAILNALRKGVKVYVLMDIEDKSNFLTKANKDTGRELKKAGAKIVYDKIGKRMHSKTMVIDKKIVYSGSHNYTHSAMKFNGEITLRVVSPELADDVIKYIKSYDR